MSGEVTGNKLSHFLKYLQAAVLIALLMYFGKALLVPMFFGLLTAMVMYPVCKWLEQHHFTRSIAIFICLLIVGMLALLLLALLGWQISMLRQDMPDILQKLRPLLPQVQNWLLEHFSVSLDLQNEWMHNILQQLQGHSGSWIGATINTTAATLFSLFIIPVHVALFLYHRGTFVRALNKFAGERYRIRLNIVLKEVIHTYFNYIKGMIMVYIIVGILNSIGLLALGIRHAVLFGMLTAVMTIIPYAGIIISASIPVSIALITKDSAWYAIGVIGVFSFVQYLEANVIFPKVVGTQLNVSTWMTLVAIIAGGIVWGVAGMVLFIPFLAMLKLVTDHIRGLDALNVLLSRDE